MPTSFFLPKLYSGPAPPESPLTRRCEILIPERLDRSEGTIFNPLRIPEMERTCASSATDLQPEPPAIAPTMGRGRGRGRGRAQPKAATLAAEPQVNFDDEVPAHAVLVGPTQVPEGFIAILVLQDALVRLVELMESVTWAGLLPVAPAVSQTGGGAQTPTTRTPEKMAPQL
ncbi:uncharacterized protein [Nicotiana sylvestris]|uniref:uncharacterized protein n=1 Tax=Nicotiana sylvestris TaxID=4096 RepID=UPI00388C8752